jgi:hypothetical protein
MIPTLRPRELRDYGPDWREVVVDCPHGAVRAAYQEPPSGQTSVERVALIALLVKHARAGGCACALGEPSPPEDGR